MPRTRQTCPLCGAMVTSPKRHVGKGPCRAAAALRKVTDKGLVPLKGKIDPSLRQALERFGVPHEVSPVTFTTTIVRGQFGSPQWHSAQINALCVPPWVAVLVALGATALMSPFTMVRKAIFLGEDFRKALVTTEALGGSLSVARQLHHERFFDED